MIHTIKPKPAIVNDCKIRIDYYIIGMSPQLLDKLTVHLSTGQHSDLRVATGYNEFLNDIVGKDISAKLFFIGDMPNANEVIDSIRKIFPKKGIIRVYDKTSYGKGGMPVLEYPIKEDSFIILE
ncbi:hypothetical protein FKX85_19700 [Echinicola soli]|uniref:Uncharacterized protein n=2 Tax=Echinicola soli TaxID=2591634 RepID=A0A514CN52_9BACT|nr:hypothetical protein FKX85_19700 [Echinicola soli]